MWAGTRYLQCHVWRAVGRLDGCQGEQGTCCLHPPPTTTLAYPLSPLTHACSPGSAAALGGLADLGPFLGDSSLDFVDYLPLYRDVSAVYGGRTVGMPVRRVWA
jgi:hypothetical protein